MDNFIKKIIKFNTLYLIGVYKSPDKDTYALLKLRKKKEELQMLESVSFSSLSELISKIDKKIPVVLVVDGKGVLNKKIDLNEEADADWLKKLDYSSIHYTSFKTEDKEFFSFCRRNVVDEVVADMTSNNIQVLDFYVGSAVSIVLKEILNLNEFYSNATYLKFIDNSLIEFKKGQESHLEINYAIGTSTISNFHVPLYGAAIHFYMHAEPIKKSTLENIGSLEFYYKKSFEKLGIFILAFFLISLLASYTLIQYYISSNAELILENSYSNKSHDIIKDLETKKDQKLKILSESGLSSKKYISYYCYEITSTVPAEISISALDVYPISKEVKKTDKVELISKTIIIKGETGSKAIFNSWIDSLKAKKWIHFLEIVSVKKDKKEVTFFELHITLNDV